MSKIILLPENFTEMIKTANYKTIFNRKKSLNKRGEALIEIQIYLAGKQKYISTGISVKPEHWIDKDNKISNKHLNYITLNSEIHKILLKFNQFEAEMIRMQQDYTIDDIIAQHKGAGAKTNKNFIQFMHEKCAIRTDIAPETKRSHKSIISHIAEFKPEMQFKDIDYKLVTEFDDYLRNKGYHQNTIKNHHKILKSYINIAIKSNILPENRYPYRNFALKEQSTTRTGITAPELSRIENLELNMSEFVLVKDLFLFSCYTGIRYGELISLKPENVITNQGHEHSLSFVMNKTGKNIKLPLSHLFAGKPEKIMIKYYNPEKKFIFPRISNEHINRILKLIATLAHINYRLTFHMSRHTFCTRLAELNPDPYLIKELAGHSDIRISMIYIHHSNAMIENKLKKISW